MAILNDWPWRHWAGHASRSDALIDGERCWSWRQLAQRVDQLACGFQRQGVAPGCGVVLRGKNSPAMLFCYLALLRCGARLLPLNPQLPESLTDTLLYSLDVRYGLCLNGRPWPSGMAALRHDPVDAPSSPPALPWQAERLATLTLTSGSSGLPKAAAHTFAAHLASAGGVLQMMAFSHGDSWLLSLPLFHVSGQGIVWRWLAAGATLVVRADRPLDTALQGCTHASLVPTQLWRLLTQNRLPPTLKAVLLGGATIPAALTRQAEAHGVTCWCGYGLTELASTVCAKRADGRAGVGLPLSGREIRLAGEEILLRGSTLASGYWRDGRLVPLVDEQGWFHTRDRGCFDKGEWRILGRLDNQFFSGGEGIQPENIESLLLTHPDVQQACVVPIDDVEFGQRPVAVVEISGATTPDEIRDWLLPQLPGFQRPVAYYLLPEALKSGGIKLSRQQVKLWVDGLNDRKKA
ncbi:MULTISPECIES: o-succinylbenzoate--CoA ligase [unclassified Brenneria]|uniref:o-succinylbenzoate--CoA ligase n=1 Tax=unclassified Brenneria TaxID=2634434 RepID=UPI0018F0832A|nr:o-succinylbenzoate--CoA ligase [Brenneria sp. L3-3C-1]MBJ7221746.1 o-succinylbenzoate--CoA ligase [Brenneria sp. L3-3C-1]MEE3642987.1 o-succinylbenzoate--CoA ligase [Brenneria sp. L3_3C_1]